MSARTKKLIAEAAKRRQRKERIQFERLLFGPQRDFVTDESRYKIACCSRRAGKSHGIAMALLKTAFEFPGSFPLYVTMSSGKAQEIIWPALQQVNEELDLGLEFKRNTGDVAVPNGSRILAKGAGSRREIDKLRGPKYPGVVIDEAQGFGSDLDYMINDVLMPATGDFTPRGWIALTGTPNAQCAGPFYEKCQEDSRWSLHSWTLLDNPHFPDPEGFCQEVMELNGWTSDSPQFLREYRGMWEKDLQGLAYQVNDEINVVNRWPEELANDWQFILGIDLGTKDPCAFTVLGQSMSLGEIYGIESHEVDDLSTTQAGAYVERLRQQYRFSRMVADSGGQGAAFIKEWATSTGLHVDPANKTDKGGKVALVNSALRSGRLKFVKSSNKKLLEDLALLQWDTYRLRDQRFVFANGFADHLPDSLQYAFAETSNVTRWQKEEPVRGTNEWWREQDKRLKEQYLSKNRQQPSWKKLLRR